MKDLDRIQLDTQGHVGAGTAMQVDGEWKWIPAGVHRDCPCPYCIEARKDPNVVFDIVEERRNV